MNKKISLLWIMILISVFISKAYANVTNDEIKFQKIFNAWTVAFNKKEFPKVCELFSKSIRADYQGAARKNYSTLCDGFQKLFQQKDMTYHNNFKIQQIYRSNDLAAVRITWFLNIYKNGKHISSTQEEGIDIFKKQAHKKWQIINFIAYPVLSTSI